MTIQIRNIGYILAKVRRKLFRQKCIGNNFKARDDDVFIASYPKSGNTWVRHMLAIVVSGDDCTFSKMDSLVPDIYSISSSQLDSMLSPRIIKTHECYSNKYQTSIYIIRDPRDVMVSYYFHNKRMNLIGNISIGEFISNIMISSAYGTWGENVNSWISAAEAGKNVLLIKYEDLLKNPVLNLEKICIHFGLNVNNKRLINVVELSKIENLKKKEKNEKKTWGPVQYSQGGMSFFRKGTMGDYCNYLDNYCEDLIKDEWGYLMKKIGYIK